MQHDLLLAHVRAYYNRNRRSGKVERLMALPVARSVLQCLPLEVRSDETPPEAFLRAARVLRIEIPTASPGDLEYLLSRARHKLVDSQELTRICESVGAKASDGQEILAMLDQGK